MATEDKLPKGIGFHLAILVGPLPSSEEALPRRLRLGCGSHLLRRQQSLLSASAT